MDIKNILAQFDSIAESMKTAEKKPTGPKFGKGYWKGQQGAEAARDRYVGASESVGSFLQELEEELARPEAVEKRDLFREFQEYSQGAVNKADSIKVDVPLLIRLLEYAREDAKTDMDLHNVAEKLIAMSQSGQTLGMEQYNDIVGAQIDEYGGVGGYGAASQAPQGTNQKPDDPAVQQQKLDQLQIQKSTNALAPALDSQGAAQPVNKVKFQDVMTKLDAQPNTNLDAQDTKQLGQLGVAASKIVQNPQTAQQFKSLMTKADQAERIKQQQVKQKQQQVGTNAPADQQTPGQPQASAGTTP